MNFEARIDAHLTEKINQFWETIPYAKHLLDKNSALNEAYYIRHRIETVLQIRLASIMDSVALSKILVQDYEAAREWGLYTIQELNHDKMFMSDLAKHGISEEAILNTRPFPATVAMHNYLVDKINETESALPAICHSLFVEWNADRFSDQAVQKVENKYSDAHVEGAKRHIQFDLRHDHFPMIIGLVEKLAESEEQVFELVDKIYDYFCQYFLELYQATVQAKACA